MTKRALLEKALRFEEREYGLEHRQVAALTSLGNAYGYLGDAQAMRDLLKKALRIQEREYGAEHRQVATTLTNLGIAYWCVHHVFWCAAGKPWHRSE